MNGDHDISVVARYTRSLFCDQLKSKLLAEHVRSIAAGILERVVTDSKNLEMLCSA
jgi:hypothetical protein